MEKQGATSATVGVTEVFTIREGEWRLMLDGIIVPAEFNSKGAAEAAIPVERARRARKALREEALREEANQVMQDFVHALKGTDSVAAARRVFYNVSQGVL